MRATSLCRSAFHYHALTRSRNWTQMWQFAARSCCDRQRRRWRVVGRRALCRTEMPRPMRRGFGGTLQWCVSTSGMSNAFGTFWPVYAPGFGNHWSTARAVQSSTKSSMVSSMALPAGRAASKKRGTAGSSIAEVELFFLVRQRSERNLAAGLFVRYEAQITHVF